MSAASPPAESVYVAPAPERASGDAATPNAAPIEVTVQGQRPSAAPDAEVITRSSARELPGSFGDPLRAVEAEPGVTPIVSGLPYFFVRGAPPASVGIFIDGIEVPLLYHAFFGPSVIHPGLFERVDLYKGAAPANYGRYAGAIIATETRAPRYELDGEASLRIIDAGALVEAPFADGRGSALVSGRYSYTGLVLSLLSNTKLQYWDYQTLDAYRLSSKSTLSVFAFGAFDLFESGDPSLAGQIGGQTQFHRVDLRYDWAPDENTQLRVALTGGYDRTRDESGSGSLRDESARVRLDLRHELSAQVGVDSGADVRLDSFRLAASPMRVDYADLTALFPSRDDGTGGAYVSLRLRPDRRIHFVPGVRADLYAVQGAVKGALDPRFSSEFQLSRRVVVEQSIGLSHQRANFLPGIPAASVGTLHGGLESGAVFDAGVRYKPGAELTLAATVFRTAFFDVVDPVGSQRDFEIDRNALNDRVTIQSEGIEARVSRPLTRHLGGFLAYTFSHSERNHGTVASISGYDRPHVLQAALTAEVGWSVRGGARAVYYSGIPALLLNEGQPHFSSSVRGPAFFRLDLRLEKRFNFSSPRYLSVVAEVLNATGSEEVLRAECGTICQADKSGPVVLPSVGVEGGF
jgi:TonB dependent receptor/TonB-dependent Receptor Plug Domain